LAPADAAITVRGIEVTQAIQSMDNSVRLIAGKPTMVRVYLDPSSLAGATLVTGEITWRRGGGGATYLPSMNRVRLDPARTPDLKGQRFELAESLNFRLPPEAIGAGALELSLDRVKAPGGERLPFSAQALTVSFVAAPPLRVRAIGLRYRSRRNPPSTVTPDALHFAYLRSYLLRAYPVASLEWSQIVVDGDNLVPPFPPQQSLLVNAQVSALRSREISAGADPRTHYFGLVDNESGANL
jgi:hypothetical protein